MRSMGMGTGIAWAKATFNPWVGCTRVSPACDDCYAAKFSKRGGWRDGAGRDLWDPRAQRRRTSPDTWGKPLRWNRTALATGARIRVFCASLADVFDNQVPTAWRADLWELVRSTPALDWLLLSKRPQNIAGMLPSDWGSGWPNVWLGATTENQTEAARRIPLLVAIPAPVHFVSAEPLLEALDLRPWLGPEGIAWVIAGGESAGKTARPMQPEWARDLRDQCQAAGVAFFFKQTGSNRIAWPGVKHSKGETMAEWPVDLQIRRFPQTAGAVI